jgi:hypothetical protein
MQPGVLAAVASVVNAILVTASIALVLLSAFLLHRDWISLDYAASFPRDVLFWTAPAALAALLLAALKLRPLHRVQLVLMGASVVISLYTAEVFLYLAQPIDSGAAKFLLPIDTTMSSDAKEEARVFAKRFGVDYDTRTRLEVITDLRHQNAQAVLATPAPDWLFVSDGAGGVKSTLSVDGVELQPLGGIARMLTVHCNESGSWVTFLSDEHGFRNPPGLWQSGTVDVAAVGDSYAEGECVPPGKEFVALIREQYPRTLNLGMRGSGPLLALAQIKEYLPAFKPKVVLWFYYEGNDLDNLNIEKRSALLRRYLDDGFTQHLLERQADIDRALTEYATAAEAGERTRRATAGKDTGSFDLISRMKVTALRARLSLLHDDVMPDPPDYDLLRDVLAEANATVGSWGGTLCFVYLPSWSSLATPPHPTEVAIPSEPDIQGRDRVLAVVHDLRLPLIDLSAAFRAERDPLAFFPFRRWGHYNESGNRFVAHAVEDKLKTIVPAPTRAERTGISSQRVPSSRSGYDLAQPH